MPDLRPASSITATDRLEQVLLACDLAEQIDLEFARERIGKPGEGRGDISSRKLRKVALGEMTAAEFANERRASLTSAREMVDRLFPKRAKA